MSSTLEQVYIALVVLGGISVLVCLVIALNQVACCVKFIECISWPCKKACGRCIKNRDKTGPRYTPLQEVQSKV